MATETTSEIIRFMGEMTAELKNINKTLAKLDAQSTTLHNDLDAVKRSLVINERDLKALHRRVDEMKIVTDDHERLKNKAFGVISFLGLLFGSVGAGIAYIVQGLMR